MAEIKWSNVDGSALNSATANVNRATDSFVRQLNTIGDNAFDFSKYLQNRVDKQAEYQRDQNAQQIINQLNQANSLDEYNQILASGVAKAPNALSRFNGQVDLSKINDALRIAPNDINKRADSLDALKDLTPEGKHDIEAFQNAVLKGDAEAMNKILQSNNLSNKQKANMLDTAYKAQADNVEYNLKFADAQANVVNNELKFQEAQKRAQEYATQYEMQHGSSPQAQYNLSRDPTYQQLRANIEATGSVLNIAQGKLNMLGDARIKSFGATKGAINTDTSAQPRAYSADAIRAQQQVQQISEPIFDTGLVQNSLSIADTVSKVFGKDKTTPRTKDDWAKLSDNQKNKYINNLLDTNTESNILSSSVPPALEGLRNSLISGDKINFSDPKTKEALGELQGYLDKQNDDLRKQGIYIPDTSIPTTPEGYKVWKDNLQKARESIKDTENKELNELYGINPEGKGLDGTKNYLRIALKDTKDKNSTNYPDLNSVKVALNEPRYNQGWFDGNDLLERAQGLYEAGFKPNEIMRIINHFTENGTKEVTGMFGSGVNGYKEIDNLIREGKKDTNRIADLRERTNKITEKANLRLDSSSAFYRAGMGLNAIQQNPNNNSSALVQRELSQSDKLRKSDQLTQRINELDYATKSLKAKSFLKKVDPNNIKKLAGNGTLDDDTVLNVWNLLGNKIPSKITEEVKEKAREDVSKVSTDKLKQVLQNNTDSETLKKQLNQVKSEAEDYEVLDKTLKKKINSLEGVLNGK